MGFRAFFRRLLCCSTSEGEAEMAAPSRPIRGSLGALGTSHVNASLMAIAGDMEESMSIDVDFRRGGWARAPIRAHGVRCSTIAEEED